MCWTISAPPTTAPPALWHRVASFTEDTGLPLTLGNFLDYYHLELILKEAEAACWLTKDELDSVQWLPADQTILEKIREMMK